MKHLFLLACLIAAGSVQAQTTDSISIDSSPYILSIEPLRVTTDTIPCEMLVTQKEQGAKAFYMTGWVVRSYQQSRWNIGHKNIAYLYPNKKRLPDTIAVWMCSFKEIPAL